MLKIRSEMSIEKKKKLMSLEILNWSVFSEVLAIDEDEEGFSKSLFTNFVDQVKETFQKIESNLNSTNFETISSLGHYIKGSAAALGLEKVSYQCERIQNYGQKINFDNFQIKQLLKKHDNSNHLKSQDCYSTKNIINSQPESFKSNTALNSNTLNICAKLKKKDIENLTSNSDDFWILLIDDALKEAKNEFEMSKIVLNDYFNDDY